MGIRRASGDIRWLEMCNRFFQAPFATLVVCLLLMMGLCSCDLYKPEQEQKPAEQPVQQVKKLPLPQRSAPPAASVDQKGAPSPAGDSVKPAQATAPPAPAAKPAPQAAAPVKKADVVPSAEKKVMPAHSEAKDKKVAGAKVDAQIPQQAKKAPAPVADKKTVPANGAAKAAAGTQKQDQKEKPATASEKQKAQQVSGRKWTVVTGPYLLEETLANDLAMVKKAGFNASVQQGSRRKTAMHRLFLAQFDDRAAAQGELDKLKKLTSDAFVLEHGGKHAVYAGSYLLDSRAVSEKERLAAAGFSLTIKRAEVAIPSKRLTVGSYPDKVSADATAKKLKHIGIKDVRMHQ